MKKIYQSTIVKIERSPNGSTIMLYVLLEDLDKSLEFLAGQFVVINIKIWDQIVRRSYSIATTMQYYQETSQLWFIIKHVSDWLMSSYFVKDAKLGDKLEIIWPVGKMTCEQNTKDADYLLISSGSGLWPIWSIYHSLKITNNYNKIWQIYGERSIDDMVVNFESEYDTNIKNIITLSRESREWFYQWYVQKYISMLLSDLNKSSLRVYICGKPAMVEESVEILNNHGIDNEFIFFEKY